MRHRIERPPPWLTLFRWGLYFLNFTLYWTVIPSIRKRLGASRSVIWSYSQRASAIVLAIFGVRPHVEGLQYLNPKRNYVVVCNHRSFFDQVTLCVTFPRRLVMLSKQAYFDMPILGTALRCYEHLPVRRGAETGLSASSRERLFQTLAEDGCVLFYPEGTRAMSDEILPFKKGAFRYASEAGVDVIPIHLIGMNRIWTKETSPLSIRGGPIRVVIAPPSSISREQFEEESERFEAEYRERHASLVREFANGES
ncbi:MAG: lysophospholipid acyltransferase family protein [Planctomycetota bacterium]|nr:lysophospholipid acyltransferase family protein [Planctomycetota bacterium]